MLREEGLLGIWLSTDSDSGNRADISSSVDTAAVSSLVAVLASALKRERKNSQL